MFGAIAGDVIGSIYEWNATKRTDFVLFTDATTFTDDTVLTVAVARALLDGADYTHALRDFALRYPDRGYGGMFLDWMVVPDMGPYNSWGNGSAMRVSAVGFARETVDEVLAEAQRSADPTHNHPEGVKGAQATALAIWLARGGAGKDDIRREIITRFGYDLDRTVDEVRPGYRFDESCQGTVPESILCFLESEGWEHAVRLAISMGGDADTMACIVGGIAHAFYGEVPGDVVREVEGRLPEEFLEIVEEFERRFGVARSK
jgi:ADP-ribosylglycohydrolase